MEKATDSLYTLLIGGGVSFITLLLGGIDALFLSCTILVILDYVTGVLAAWYNDVLTSRDSWRGIVRKTISLSLIIVAHQLDVVVGNEGHFMRNAMLMFIMATEGISILENCGKMGLKYPAIIMKALKNLQQHPIESKPEKMTDKDI
ncbi:phage holin family protein [Paenibacillus sp. SC116]|uniref:phage holin family protein n=1 Tax=Paenibacillus sp. SC116 TaxID=2968986 RepID=UPI00215A1568|nr:phage holin family protein [Paenibacillus sp. SC116]MCR8843913.1 phage holin family protein [Paenibacillus sp. SC116]